MSENTKLSPLYYKAVHENYEAYQPSQGVWKPGTTVENEEPKLTVGDREIDVPYIKIPGRLVVAQKPVEVSLKDYRKIGERHLFSATSWDVIDEIPFWNVFGVNGEAVLDVVNRYPHLEEETENQFARYFKSNAQHIELARKNVLKAIKTHRVARPYYFILREMQGYSSLVALTHMMKEDISPEEHEVVTSIWDTVVL